LRERGVSYLVLSKVHLDRTFIYNPDHVDPTNDANTADVEVVADVDPTMLTLTDAYPVEVFEGAGTGGAHPALVVIYGRQIAPDAVVTITPDNAVKVVATTVAGDHNFLALSLEVDDDAVDNDGLLVPLSIAVAQAGGTYHDVLDAKVSVHHLDALTAVPTGALRERYSQVAITGDWTLGAGPHLAVRAVGSISITGKVNANAVGATPGPGGCAGGAIGIDGAAQNAETRICTGRGHAVAGGLLNGGGGGGAGFVVKGESGASSGGVGGDAFGTKQVPSFADAVPSGGGGGAKNTGAGGGAGGGGGGAVEFTAGGDLAIPMGISAHGGKGTDVTNGGGGGGGDGGVILVRAGGTTTLGTLDVARGEPGLKTGTGNGVAGGAGSVGRTRVDATTMIAADYHGPMFLAPPQISLDQNTTLAIRGDIGDQTLVGQVYDRDASAVPHGDFSPQVGGNAQASPPFALRAGYNKVCVGVAGGNAFTLPESTNCTELAFLPH
ncbi:MAG: hypothetical protein ABI678_09180, partial [Kofleriaceae bacterium]